MFTSRLKNCTQRVKNACKTRLRSMPHNATGREKKEVCTWVCGRSIHGSTMSDVRARLQKSGADAVTTIRRPCEIENAKAMDIAPACLSQKWEDALTANDEKAEPKLTHALKDESTLWQRRLQHTPKEYKQRTGRQAREKL